jgi:hypothetical protein
MNFMGAKRYIDAGDITLENDKDYLFWCTVKAYLGTKSVDFFSKNNGLDNAPNSVILEVSQEVSDPNIIFLLEDAPNDYLPHLYISEIQDRNRAGEDIPAGFSDYLFQEHTSTYRWLMARAAGNYLLGDDSAYNLKIILDEDKDVAQILRMYLISSAKNLHIDLEDDSSANIALHLLMAGEFTKGDWVSPAQKKEYMKENLRVPGFYQVVERHSRDGELLSKPLSRLLVYVDSIEDTGFSGLVIDEPFSLAERRRMFSKADSDVQHLYRGLLEPSDDYRRVSFSFVDTGVLGCMNVLEDRYMLSRLEGSAERRVSCVGADGGLVEIVESFSASEFVYWCLRERGSSLDLSSLSSSAWDRLNGGIIEG